MKMLISLAATAAMVAAVTSAQAQTRGVRQGSIEYSCLGADIYKRQFHLGGESAARKPEQVIRALVPTVRQTSGTLPAKVVGAPAFTVVDAAVTCLQSHYKSRADRQQTWLDRSGAITALGSIIALGSGGAGQVTQTRWAALGLAPVLNANIQAYEPTRELYEAGSGGIDRLRGRYVDYERVLQGLEASFPQKPLATSATGLMKMRCDAARTQAELTEGWANDVPRQALLSEARAVVRTCDAAAANDAGLTALRTEANLVQARAPEYYARDVLALHDQMVSLDRQVRHTPAKTLSTLVASPFLAVGELLVGEDGVTTANGMKEAALLSGLSVDLSPLGLTPAPKALDPVEPLSASAGDVVDGWLKTEKDVDRRKKVITARAALDAANTALITYQGDVALAHGQAQELARLARQTKLEMKVDDKTRQAAMVLAEPAPPEPKP